MTWIRSRLTYANVMSTLAVFLVLGGGVAYAARKIGANELRGGSVTAAKIKRRAVRTSKLANEAVGTGKIAKGAVTWGRLADGSVSVEKLVPGFVAPFAAQPSRAANVSASGAVVLGSVGVSQANVAHPAAGFYCISGLDPAPAGGVATVDYSEAGKNVSIQLDTGRGPVCPEGTQAFVDPRETSGKFEPVDAGFFLILY
jgi:hypothetical protein